MPDVRVHIKGDETTSGPAAAAARSIHNIREAAQQTIQPARDLAQTVRAFAELGGAAIILRQVAQGITQVQMAYEKLNPEAAHATGSLTNWTLAVTEMKGRMGGIVDTYLNPVRAWFIDMLDPTFNAMQALRDYNTEWDKFIAAHSSAAKKELDDYNLTLAAQTKAANDLADATGRVETLRNALNAARTASAGITEPGVFSGMAATGASLSRQGSEKAISDAVARALAAIAENTGKIQTAMEALEVANQWLADHPLGGKAAETAAATAAATALIDAYELAGDYMREAATGVNMVGEAVAVTAGAVQAATAYMQEAATGAFPEPMRIFGGGNGNGAPSPEYAAFRAQQGSGQGGIPGTDPLAGLFAALSGPAMQLANSFKSVQMILDPLSTIIGAAVAVLQPFVDSALAPIVGILVTLGTALGQILVPIVQALMPVIQLLAELFVWIYNLALVPFGNLIIFIGNMLFNLGQFIKNLIAMDFAHLDKGTRPATYGFLQPITLDTVTAAGEAATSGNTYSSNVTVQKPADVYIYFTIQGNVIGAASKEELGAWLVDCIQKALGTGVRPEFLQGAA
jgi:hypothetical protein